MNTEKFNDLLKTHKRLSTLKKKHEALLKEVKQEMKDESIFSFESSKGAILLQAESRKLLDKEKLEKEFDLTKFYKLSKFIKSSITYK